MPRRPIDPATYSPAMASAVRALEDAGLRHEVMTAHQIKAGGNVSFYPGKGTIYRDSDQKALPEYGLNAFIALLQREPFQVIVFDTPSSSERNRTPRYRSRT